MKKIKISGYILYLLTFAAPLIFLSACDIKSSIEKEIALTFQRDQFSAKGSDLTFAVCGWPVQERMELDSVKVTLDYGSSRKSGSGYADISAFGKEFRCSGKIFFGYGRYFAGGHGYFGGYEDLNINFRRESDVAGTISSAGSARELKPGIKISAEISGQSERLPDGSFADFYFIDVEEDSPVFKITISGNKNFFPKDYWYQDKKIVTSSNWGGARFKKGRIYLMITGRRNIGSYSFIVEEIIGNEKMKFR